MVFLTICICNDSIIEGLYSLERGIAMTNTIYTINEIRDKAAPIAESYEIKNMYLFGSYARGEADEESDLDFYAVTQETMGLIEYMGFILDLEEEFGCHVDVLSGYIDDKDFYNNIINDSIHLYGEKKPLPAIKALVV